MKVTVSKMTGKLKGIAGINTNPLSNTFCQKMQKTETICKDCYSCSMLRGIRKNCEPAWERNSVALSTRLLEGKEIPVIGHAFARFHAHGELINEIHFQNFIKIARANKHCKFAFFTKRTNLVTSLTRLPANVTMVYSNPSVDKVMVNIPKGFHKTFNVVTEESEKINCGARSCITCQKCFKRTGAKVLIEKLK